MIRILVEKADVMLYRLERGFAVLVFVGLALLITFNIFSRNIFETSFQSILEIAPRMVLWLACVGATLALRNNRHIKLELLLRYAPPPARRFARVSTAFFGMGVMMILFFAAVVFVKNEIAIFGADGWMALIFPIFFCLAAFRYLIHLISVIYE